MKVKKAAAGLFNLSLPLNAALAHAIYVLGCRSENENLELAVFKHGEAGRLGVQLF